MTLADYLADLDENDTVSFFDPWPLTAEQLEAALAQELRRQLVQAMRERLLTDPTLH